MGSGRVIVADSSPLVALATIQQIELLPALFSSVFVPSEVRALDRGGWPCDSRGSVEANVGLQAGRAPPLSLCVERPDERHGHQRGFGRQSHPNG